MANNIAFQDDLDATEEYLEKRSQYDFTVQGGETYFNAYKYNATEKKSLAHRPELLLTGTLHFKNKVGIHYILLGCILENFVTEKLTNFLT
jgi:hypothetical protein